MKTKKNAWLIKSEPSVYPWSKLVTDGSTRWDGIRSYEARNNLRAMKVDDVCLFYHSNEGKEIVGIALVTREAYADPTSDEDWSAVEIAALAPMKAPVSLDAIKKHPKLEAMALVKKSRLSVGPVTQAELAVILAEGKTKVRA